MNILRYILMSKLVFSMIAGMDYDKKKISDFYKFNI